MTPLLLLSLLDQGKLGHPEVKKLAEVYKASKCRETGNLTCGLTKPCPHLQSHLEETADPSSRHSSAANHLGELGYLSPSLSKQDWSRRSLMCPWKSKIGISQFVIC